VAITTETNRVIKKEIARLNKERDELEEMIKKLEDALVATTRKAGRTARKAVGRPKKTGAKRGRKPAKSWKPSGRAAEILKVVKANPGITTTEIAKKIKVKSPANVYPPLNKLKDNGFVKKSGKGYAAK
jgi:DNA-binding transcriptional ArsR family regulator